MKSLGFTFLCVIISIAVGQRERSSDKRPNFLVILADDLGWYDTSLGGRNEASPTPTLTNLSRTHGLVLDRHYVFRYCSPTRRSLLTGRFPNHITTVQPDGKDLCSDVLPLNATLISEKLREYDSFFVGKAHLGFQTEDHLPIRRGFNRHVGFLAGSESYRHGGGAPNCTQGKHDLWQNDAPAYDLVPEITYATNFYTSEAVNIIETRNETSPPFFMYFAIQNVHSPYELPPEWEQHDFPEMWDRTYANMLAVLDSATENLTQALHRAGIWDDTLILWSADNGGIGLGNNFPLRGHKHDPYEGGTRAAAFLSGGFLSPHVRGTTSTAFVHVSDWWPTFCHLAGVEDCTDQQYFSGDHRIHDIDGSNVWPMLMGSNKTQPRAITPISEVSLIDVSRSDRWFKIIVSAGQSVYYDKNQTTRNGSDPCLAGVQPDPVQPGRTDALVNGCPVCNATHVCLFDILHDPSETSNVASDYPDVASHLARLVSNFQTPYVTGTLTPSELERYDAISDVGSYWNGFLGPCYLHSKP